MCLTLSSTVFTQSKYLKGVLKDLKSGRQNAVIEDLEAVRTFLLSDPRRVLFQITRPSTPADMPAVDPAAQPVATQPEYHTYVLSTPRLKLPSTLNTPL